MGILEKIQNNGISILIIWSSFLFSIFISHIYQRVRIYKDSSGEVKIKAMSNINQYMWTFLIIIGPTLIIGLRSYYVGADTFNYVAGYLRSGLSFGIDDLLSVNQLFNLFRYTIYSISGANPTIFLLVFAFSTLFILVRALNKWIGKLSISFALFIYYSVLGMQLFNQSRQMFSISIIMYAIPYIFQKKMLRYYTLVLIATLFHFTAIIGILFPILQFTKTRYYSLKRWFYFSIWLIIPFLLPYILRITSIILPDSYSHYLFNISKMEIGLGLLLNIAPVFIPILLLKRRMIDKESHLFLRLAILVFPLRLSGYYSYYLMRLQYYSLVFMILLVPLSLQRIPWKSNKKVMSLMLVVFFMIYYLVTFVYLDDGGMFPYKTIFSAY